MKISDKLHLLIIFAFFANLQLKAQDVPEIIPPAPNAAALAQYADIPVSKYKGVHNISISIKPQLN